ncbi:Ulp1 protease family C-terminal catalytic domain-containing protein, partial [Phytophthora infestans]
VIATPASPDMQEETTENAYFASYKPKWGSESSGASESDTTSGNNATVSNRGSGDSGIVARDDLVHVSKIDVKMFDDWKTLEAYFRTTVAEHTRKIGCPAQINACVRETGNREVCITGQKTGHNHDVSQEIYQTYHEARNVSEGEVISTIRTLHRAGPVEYVIVKNAIHHWSRQRSAPCQARTGDIAVWKNNDRRALSRYRGGSNCEAQQRQNDGFRIPSDVLRSPNFDVESIKHQAVWKDLENARTSMNLDKDRLLFFAAINYGLNDWCAVTVDFNSNEVKVYDPQQAGDRFKHLRAYLKSELLPRLPQRKSPKRFRFTRCQWLTQLVNYNCGVFVLMFFELCILGYDFASRPRRKN